MYNIEVGYMEIDEFEEQIATWVKTFIIRSFYLLSTNWSRRRSYNCLLNKRNFVSFSNPLNTKLN